MDTIIIKALTVEAIIGVLPQERIQKQPIIINLEIKADIKKAAQSDDLQDTVDYLAIATRIQEYVSQSQHQLLEKLAEQLSRLIINEFSIHELKLEILKPAAIPGAQAAGLIIERKSSS